ncbi:hypothetical protein ACQKP8_24390 [Photobacterium alginatilyticum]|uniref:hypothetical protein n=1 Tax=Photobacterium alginatilyticum TaxID=1775171 RepID=UPI0040678FF5
MNDKLLKKSLDVLKLLKSEMHDDIDSKTENELNLVISQIEKELKDGKKRVEPDEILSILGKCVAFFKGVVDIINFLSDFLE